MNFKPLDIIDMLKQIRKKYNIKQKELDCQYLNKKVYSYIETRRRELSEKTLEKIIQRFNEILNSRNIDYKITKQELTISFEKQVANFIKIYLQENELENFKEVEDILNQYPSSEGRGMLYNALGLKESKNKNYNEAIKYFFLATNHSIISSDYKTLSEIIYQLTRCHYFLGLKDELKNIYKNFKKYFDKLEKKDYILYNISLGFYQCKEYEATIKILEKINTPLDEKFEFKVFLLKNICLENMNELKKSEEIYLKRLKIETVVKHKKLLLTNLIENYRKQNNFESAKKNMIEYINILNNFTEKENQNSYWLLGRLFKDFGETISSKLYYLRGILIGINLGDECFDSENYYTMFSEYLELCDNYNEIVEVEYIYNEMIKSIFNLQIRFLFVKKYLELERIDDVKRIIKI